MTDAISLHLLAQTGLYTASRIDQKLAVMDRLAALSSSGLLDFTVNEEIRPATAVVFPEHPRRVEPRQLAKRNLMTPAGKVAFFHALAHIEFTAILLALDMAYRFQGLPPAFYQDWLRVALEETVHFRLLRGRLQELGADYGDLPAHHGLWSTAEETAHDVLARLALVPRCMEARGLDVTPGMIDKLRLMGASDDVAILERIYQDEIGHVALGSDWFRFVCQQRGQGVEPTYFHLLKQYLPGDLRGPFNLSARRQAGFEEAELARLAAC